MLRNQIEYKVFGMRRSGNHAIIHWMAAHFDRPCHMVNDICDFNTPKVLPEDYIHAGELDCFTVPSSDASWIEDKEVLIQTYEDYDLSDLDWDSNLVRVGPSGVEKSILIIRDPYNLMASRAAKKEYHLLPISRFAVERWKQHAREALGETSFLKNKVVINYNRWFEDDSYRRELELELGLPGTTDETVDRVVMAGSSFTGIKRDGEARRMKVNERWRMFANSEFYIRLFDKRTRELADMLGFKCEMEGFIR